MTKKVIDEKRLRNWDGEGGLQGEFYTEKENAFLPPLQFQNQEELILTMEDYKLKDVNVHQQTSTQEEG